MTAIPKVCSWCKADLGTVEGDFDMKYPVTHGMCANCARVVAENPDAKTFQEFLDGFGIPLMVVDGENLVLAASRQVKDLLGKESPRVVGRHFGDVIECPNARLAGGCGKTLHCQSCVIRKTVLKTHQTGEGCFLVPAYPDVQIGSKVKTLSMKITAEKVGTCVLLWIEEMRTLEKVELD